MPIRVFPIIGGARFSNDFGVPRSSGRTHQGNDLFAPAGAQIIAVDDGEVRFGIDPLGGNIANLYADDGARYYYAHMQEPGSGAFRVHLGDVVGHVGNTGNAATTPPHLHFEAHPNRGRAVNPYPSLVSAPQATEPELGDTGLRPLTAVLLASAAAVGAWALMNPKKARRTVRRWLPA